RHANSTVFPYTTLFRSWPTWPVCACAARGLSSDALPGTTPARLCPRDTTGRETGREGYRCCVPFQPTREQPTCRGVARSLAGPYHATSHWDAQDAAGGRR